MLQSQREKQSFKTIQKYFGPNMVLSKVLGYILKKVNNTHTIKGFKSVDIIRDTRDIKEDVNIATIFNGVKKSDVNEFIMYTIMSVIKSYVILRSQMDIEEDVSLVGVVGHAIKDVDLYYTSLRNNSKKYVVTSTTTRRLATEYKKYKSVWKRVKRDNTITFKKDHYYPFVTRVAEILVEHGIFGVYYVLKNGKKTRFINEFKFDIKDGEMLREVSVYKPLIEKPIPWMNPNYGGFHTIRNYIIRNNFIKQDVGYDVLDAINTMQNTGFVVDEYMLGVVRYCYDNNLYVGKKFDMRDDYKGYNYKKAAIYGSLRIRVLNAIKEAESLVGNPFYYVYRLDRRGRVYPDSDWFHYQMNEYCRSLHRMEYKKPIGEMGETYLWQYAASLYGVKYKSFEERMQLMYDMRSLMYECADNPFACVEWMKADEPFRFLQVCKELRDLDRYTAGGAPAESFESNLIYSCDGSTNGFQHLSAMSRDISCMKAVNLVGNIQNDIYSDIMKIVKADTGYDFLTRDLAKKLVMTIPYGSTHYGNIDYIVNYLVKHNKGFDKSYNTVASNIAKSFYNAIKTLYPGVMRCISEFKQSASKHVKSTRLTYHTPVGFEVDLSYPKYAKMYVKLIGGKVGYNMPTDELDSSRVKTASIANMIHSFDACHMMMTVNAFGCDFVSVHDEYGCHVGDAELLHKSIRQSFYDLHSQDHMYALFKMVGDDAVRFMADDTFKSILKGVFDSDFIFI